MLKLENISHSYGDQAVLQGVTLRAGEGETVAIAGPSGCGKTTLLRVVAGLVMPHKGSITFAGKKITAANLADLRLRTGYVIQEGGLFPHLCARDNVTLMARFLEKAADWIVFRVAELAELVHLDEALLEKRPRELSGGQRQRAALMRALMLDPDLLLLDEPLGALDPITRHRLQDELKEMFARLGKTVLLVTHDVAEAAFFSDRIVLMEAGRIAQEGSAAGLLSDPANDFVREFMAARRELPNEAAS